MTRWKREDKRRNKIIQYKLKKEVSSLSNEYRVAIYLRLSRDDGNEESQSIQSQREMLTSYVNEQGWSIYDEYVDDGFSGTNFNRPDFQRMIDDIERGIINMVITKDLSRLGRNYIQVGYYTEDYFPEKRVRYIAINDSYDSDNEDGNDFVPLRNFMNEWYAKDTSKKIRSILNEKAKNGEPRNTVVPIYGYTYNEKHERVPERLQNQRKGLKLHIPSEGGGGLPLFILEDFAEIGRGVESAAGCDLREVQLLVFHQKLLIELLTRAQANLLDLNVNLRLIARKLDHIDRKIINTNRFTHIQNEKLALFRHRTRLHNKLACFGNCHEITNNPLIRNGNGTTVCNLTFKERNDRAV